MNINFVFDREKEIERKVATTELDSEPHTYLVMGYFNDGVHDEHYYLVIIHNIITDEFNWEAYYTDIFGDCVHISKGEDMDSEIDSEEYEKAKEFVREIENE